MKLDEFEERLILEYRNLKEKFENPSKLFVIFSYEEIYKPFEYVSLNTIIEKIQNINTPVKCYTIEEAINKAIKNKYQLELLEELKNEMRK